MSWRRMQPEGHSRGSTGSNYADEESRRRRNMLTGSAAPHSSQTTATTSTSSIAKTAAPSFFSAPSHSPLQRQQLNESESENENENENTNIANAPANSMPRFSFHGGSSQRRNPFTPQTPRFGQPSFSASIRQHQLAGARQESAFSQQARERAPSSNIRFKRSPVKEFSYDRNTARKVSSASTPSAHQNHRSPTELSPITPPSNPPSPTHGFSRAPQPHARTRHSAFAFATPSAAPTTSMHSRVPLPTDDGPLRFHGNGVDASTRTRRRRRTPALINQEAPLGLQRVQPWYVPPTSSSRATLPTSPLVHKRRLSQSRRDEEAHHAQGQRQQRHAGDIDDNDDDDDLGHSQMSQRSDDDPEGHGLFCNECNAGVDSRASLAKTCDVCQFAVCLVCWARSSRCRSDWTCPRCLSSHQLNRRCKADYSLKSSVTTQTPRFKRILSDARQCAKKLGEHVGVLFECSDGDGSGHTELAWHVTFLFPELEGVDDLRECRCEVAFPSEYPAQSPLLNITSSAQRSILSHVLDGVSSDGWLCLGHFLHGSSAWSSRMSLAEALVCVRAQLEETLAAASPTIATAARTGRLGNRPAGRGGAHDSNAQQPSASWWTS